MAEIRTRRWDDPGRSGESLTLLCSSACEDETRCHRSILRDLIVAAAGSPSP